MESMDITKHVNQLEAKQYLSDVLGKLSHLIAENQPIPDSLEEEILMLELVINPKNWENTYKLVAAIFRQGRWPIPETLEAGSDSQLDKAEWAEVESLEALAASAEMDSDTITVFAAAWAIILRFPNSAYGLTKLSLILAERGRFVEAHLFFRRILSRQPLADFTWRALAETASVIAEYQPWLAGQLLADLRTTVASNDLTTNIYEQEVARIAGALASDTLFVPQPLDSCSSRELRLLAKHCFSVNQFSEAYDLFVRAIQLDQADSIRDILRNFGGPFGHLLHTQCKEIEIRNIINDIYDGDCNLISAWHSFESLQSARKARSIALDRQLPSVLLVTPGKSGSVAVGNILSSGFDLPTMATAISTNNVIPAWATEFARGGVMQTSQMSATPQVVHSLAEAGVQRAIVHTRDPRQIIVSLAHHLPKYKDQFGSIKGFSEVVAKPLQERIDFLIIEKLPYLSTWLKRWFDAQDRMDIKFTTYEMFVLDRDSFLETLLAHYGGDTRFFNATNANSASGVDSHFRKGSVNEWRSVLTKQQLADMNRIVGDELLAIFGWGD